jgi:TolA-binding protein
MAPLLGPHQRFSALVTAMGILLLAGCTPWWQRHPASQPDGGQQHCKALAAEQQLLERQRQADTQALTALAREPYPPSPVPEPPDPELAKRYSQLDQQLDDERYDAELEAWRLREEQRRQRWTETQRDRRLRLQQRLDDHNRGLAALKPKLGACPGQG